MSYNKVQYNQIQKIVSLFSACAVTTLLHTDNTILHGWGYTRPKSERSIFVHGKPNKIISFKQNPAKYDALYQQNPK